MLSTNELPGLLFVAGIIMILAGRTVRLQDQMIEKQQEIMRDIAVDNMALRIQLHTREVEENA